MVPVNPKSPKWTGGRAPKKQKTKNVNSRTSTSPMYMFLHEAGIGYFNIMKVNPHAYSAGLHARIGTGSMVRPRVPHKPSSRCTGYLRRDCARSRDGCCRSCGDEGGQRRCTARVPYANHWQWWGRCDGNSRPKNISVSVLSPHGASHPSHTVMKLTDSMSYHHTQPLGMSSPVRAYDPPVMSPQPR